ncbi:MAG: VCBS repeat-containing protein [Pseudomonadota bacterium]
MRKLLTLVFILIMAFSFLLIIACDNKADSDSNAATVDEGCNDSSGCNDDGTSAWDTDDGDVTSASSDSSDEVFDEIENVNLLFSGGKWYSSGYTVTAAKGCDIDGDGRDEVIVGRKANDEDAVRIYVYEDANSSFELMDQLGTNWDASSYVTDIACGDVTGDGKADFVVSNYTTGSDDDSNELIKWKVYSYTNVWEMVEFVGGGGTGNFSYAQDVDDVDGDGDTTDAISTCDNDYTDNADVYLDSTLATGDDEIKDECIRDDAYATGVAVGDLDSDGIDEIVVSYRTTASDEARVIVYDNFDDEDYDGDEVVVLDNLVTSGASVLGSDSFYATSVAVGEIDDDPDDVDPIELVASFYTTGSTDAKFIMWDWDSSTQEVSSSTVGGTGWNAATYPTHITIGKPYNDNHVVAMSRFVYGVENEEASYAKLKEYVFLDDEFYRVFNGGTTLNSEYYATWVSMCDINGDGNDETLLALQGEDGGTKVRVYGDGYEEFQPSLDFGDTWDNDISVSSVECGDFDGDGRSEIIIARNTDDYGEVRFLIYEAATTYQCCLGESEATADLSDEEAVADEEIVDAEAEEEEAEGEVADADDDDATDDGDSDATAADASEEATADASADAGAETDVSAATEDTTVDAQGSGCGMIPANGEQDAAIYVLLALMGLFFIRRKQHN